MERYPTMNTRRWLVPLLLVGLGCCSVVQARPLRRMPPQFRPPGTPAVKDPERPSHRPIDSDLDEDLKPEDLLAKRLRGSRDWLNNKELRAQWLKKLAEGLRNDPEAQKKLRKALKQYTAKDLELLQKKLEGGQFDDPAVQRFLKDLFKAREDGSGIDLDKLLKGYEGIRPNTGPDPSSDPTPNRSESPHPNIQSGPQPTPLDPKFQTKLPDGSADWLAERAKDFEKWIESPSGQSWQESFKRLAQGRWEGGSALPKFTESARGLTRYLPRMSRFLPQNLNVKTPEPRLPSLPNLGLSRAARLPSAPSAETGKAVLWVVVLGVLALVLWRCGGGLWQKYQASRKGNWQLGPWPVRPEDVATRADLVRAFEHLALMCLGPTARTCHHLALGEQIGQQPALDPDRRRDAADSLARLYEQARYTPEEEPLPPETLASARRELCYLAGVMPA